MKGFCQSCGAAYEAIGRVSRMASCESCEVDLHACVQCAHYDPFAHHHCKEPHAELVSDVERANVCEFFSARADAPKTTGGDARAQALSALDALFKK